MKKFISGKFVRLAVSAAAFALFLGNSVVSLSVYPFWHYEPELPDTLKAQLQD